MRNTGNGTRQKASGRRAAARASNAAADAAPASGPTAAAHAYDTILGLILTLKIRPGEVVTELDLAERTGLGRTPVREALKRLEAEGLVVTTNRTRRIYLLTMREIEEIFDLKIAIESAMAGWAVARADDAGLKRLKSLLTDLKRIAAARPADPGREAEWLARWLECDAALHGHIFSMAGNRRAATLVATLNTQWHRLRLGILTMEGRIEKSLREHEEFVAAILARDAPRAQRTMRDHLANLKQTLMRMMQVFNYPDA